MSKEKALKLINEYLAKQQPKKVNLGLIDDFKSSYKRMKGIYDTTIQKFNQAQYKAKQVKSLADDYNQGAKLLLDLRKDTRDGEAKLENYSKSILKDVNKIEKAYKDLGESLPSELSSLIREVKGIEKETRGLSTKIDIFPVI